MYAIELSDLTSGHKGGEGVYDVLMKAFETHIHEEYQRSRIKGPEYSQVYLGGLTAVMDQAVRFLLEKDQAALQAKMVEAQILKIEKEVELAEKELLIKDRELDLMDKQIDLAEQDLLLKAKDLELKEAQIELAVAGLPKLVAETAMIEQQTTNLVAQAENIPKEGEVLDAQVCKLRAEFDLLAENKLKALAETGLLNQKKITEAAQTSGIGVDPQSVLGKQMLLYQGQADGFKRDAEQKAARLLLDSWNARRMTDESGTQANEQNLLYDPSIGQAVSKLLAGINA